MLTASRRITYLQLPKPYVVVHSLVYMHIYIYVCIYIYIHVYIYICIYIYVFICGTTKNLRNTYIWWSMVEHAVLLFQPMREEKSIEEPSSWPVAESLKGCCRLSRGDLGHLRPFLRV